MAFLMQPISVNKELFNDYDSKQKNFSFIVITNALIKIL